MKVWQWGLSMTVILSLAACGGGGSGTEDEVLPSLTSISGQVADGYLAGAKVCLDINENKKCEDGEPFAITLGKLLSEDDRFGQFTIEVDPTNYPDPGKFPLFVEVPADALDKDTGGEVGKGYTLSAPPGRPEFISPITTLIHQQMEKNPVLSTEEAEMTVKGQLGVSDQVSLFDDYVKEKDNDNLEAPAREEFARVHMVAQVVARTMGDLQTEVNEAATVANIGLAANSDAIVKLVVDEVMKRLQTIVARVEEASLSGTTTPFDADAVTTTVKNETTSTITSESITGKIEEQKAVITKSSFEKMLEGDGTFWIEHWFDGQQVTFEYGNVKLVDGQPVDIHYEWNGVAWVQGTNSGDDDWILRNGVWQPYSDGASGYAIIFNADGSAQLTQKESGLQEILRAVEYDLAGKPHSVAVGTQLDLLLDSEAVFPAGAKGYKMSFMPLEDVYSVDSWTDGQGNEQNYVRYWDGSVEQALTSVEGLKQTFAKDSGRHVEIAWGEWGFSLAGQFGADGVLHLFERSNGSNQTPKALAKTGTWSQVNVQGVPMIKIVIPDVFRAQYAVDDIPFFVVKDGKVRRGRYSPANEVEVDSEFNINKTAFDNLLWNLNFDYTPPGTTDPGGSTYPDPGKKPLPPLDGGIAADLQQAMTEGVTWFEIDKFMEQDGSIVEIGYESVSVDGSGNLVEEFHFWDADTSDWIAEDETESFYVLQANGWTEMNDDPTSCSVSFQDGTTVVCADLSETVNATEYDIAGLSIGNVLPVIQELLPSEAPTFPAGSMAYRFEFTALSDSYEVENDDWAVVGIYGQNGGHTPIGSFDDLPSAFPAGQDTYGSFRIENGLQCQFDANGSLAFLADAGFENPPQLLPLGGTYEEVTVHGESLLMLNIPLEYREMFAINYQPFLVEWSDGTVRFGEFIQAGAVQVDDEYALNPTAFDFVWDNLLLP